MVTEGAGWRALFSERMTPHKPKILVTRRLPASIEARMATLFETDVNEADLALTTQKPASMTLLDSLLPDPRASQPR